MPYHHPAQPSGNASTKTVANQGLTDPWEGASVPTNTEGFPSSCSQDSGFPSVPKCGNTKHHRFFRDTGLTSP